VVKLEKRLGVGDWSKPFGASGVPALGHSQWEVLFRCREKERESSGLLAGE